VQKSVPAAQKRAYREGARAMGKRGVETVNDDEFQRTDHD
jgi:hypothetical protein